MPKEKVVEINFNDKTVKVYVKEISWWEAQDIIDESTEIVNDKAKVMMGKLKQNLIKRAISRVEGMKVSNIENLLKIIPRSEARKIFEAVLELNPLEELMM